MKKSGFTLIELIIAVVMMVILTGTVIFTFLVCFRSWNAAENRSKMRSQISQSMELMVKSFRQGIDFGIRDKNKIAFLADLGEGEIKHAFFLLKEPDTDFFQLLRNDETMSGDQGSVMASGIESEDVFSWNGNIITINLIGNSQGATFQMQTNVRPRNL
jgi:prepilin-type N-terminal cleavage/methylation domain-containing protein